MSDTETPTSTPDRSAPPPPRSQRWRVLALAASWVIVSVAIGAWYGPSLANLSEPTPDFSASRLAMLPGDTTHGHYQIELQCSACHTPSGGVEQQACIKCHAAELKAANDSHPEAKFDDPRNADRLEKLNAAQCVTCHTEHKPDRTHAMGVTLPLDYCYQCHQDIGKERPSHLGMKFDTCASAGCHNYHDNTALYENFLARHLNLPPTLDAATVPVRPRLPVDTQPIVAPDAPPTALSAASVNHDWTTSRHAVAGVNCTACHNIADPATKAVTWVDKPGYDSCNRCHETQTDGFHRGRHGMRLAAGMTPMTPALARLPMKPDALQKQLNCNACHDIHTANTVPAAVNACMSCHDDPHTNAYKASPHFALWEKELKGESPPGTGVSCATCHMPRREIREDGETRVFVEHNQNDNLRPNEKMLRTACLNCHGLGFAIDALADPASIRSNFAHPPKVHIESLDLVRRRLDERKQSSPRTAEVDSTATASTNPEHRVQRSTE